QAFTNLWTATTVNRGCRSTPRIASTARRATSRTRPRTSTGSHPKEAEDPITRTCKWLAGAAFAGAMMASTPAWAVAVPSAEDVRLAYVEARAAAMTGDHSRSAALLASLAQSQPQDVDLARKALAEAIGSGQIELGLKLARTI